MQNTQLEKKIQNLSTGYTYQETVSSLLLLLLSVVDEENKQEPLFTEEIHADILAIKKDIRNYVLQLEELLNTNNDTKQNALNHCIENKKQLLHQYETIYRYFSLWNIYSTALVNEIILRKYKKDSAKDECIQWDEFFADCYYFLNSTETILEQNQNISQLLGCLPIKMAREKYFDMVKKRLLLNFEGESKETIDISIRTFLGFFSPERVEGYGKYFSEITKWFSSKKTLSPPALSDEALEQEYDEFQEIFQTLSDIEDYFSSIFNDLNTLILLFSLSYSFEDLTQDNIAYSDLYHAVCEILNGEIHEAEKEAILDASSDSLNTHIEVVIDKLNAINKKKFALMKKVSNFDSFSDDTKKILLVEDFARSCYYGDLNNELFRFGLSEESPAAEESYINAACDKFISQLREYMGELPVALRRACQEMLLSSLPPAIDADEAVSLVENAIQCASSLEEKKLILDKAGFVFEDNGFKSHFEDDDEEDEHHHHGHDCGCGHHH